MGHPCRPEGPSRDPPIDGRTHEDEMVADVAETGVAAEELLAVTGIGAEQPSDSGALVAALDRAEYRPFLAAVRQRLDPTTFAAAWEEGHNMAVEQAVAYVLGEG